MAASQVLHPSRATVRTLFQSLVSFAAIFPAVVDAAGLPQWGGIVVAVAVAGGVTRVMALPQVETFFQRFLPWLSATPVEAVAEDVAVPDYEADLAADSVSLSGTSTPDTSA